jgi:organic hydroperoxide reductase OsmC/OhrA
MARINREDVVKISAQIYSSRDQHQIRLATNDQSHSIKISPKVSGFGSSTNGGELLFLALATCYCNDIYREAARRSVVVERVEVEVDGEFGSEGEPARRIEYRAKVWAHAPEQAVRDLIEHTDRVAEIQNTLRSGSSIKLTHAEVVVV